jgi:hypothetical protein
VKQVLSALIDGEGMSTYAVKEGESNEEDYERFWWHVPGGQS